MSNYNPRVPHFSRFLREVGTFSCSSVAQPLTHAKIYRLIFTGSVNVNATADSAGSRISLLPVNAVPAPPAPAPAAAPISAPLPPPAKPPISAPSPAPPPTRVPVRLPLPFRV